MKQTSFLTRCLALALALVLLASNANLGLTLQAFAANSDETVVTAGELVASNYELTDAEKDLLNSGYLAGGTYSYTVPSGDDLVTVNTEKAEITAKYYNEWVPTSAAIVVGGETKEAVALNAGVGTYNYDGNAFSVVVTYALYAEVSANEQNNLLNAAASLKQGIANVEAVYGSDANLGVVVEAMDSLEKAANGIDMGFTTVQFGADAIAAVNALKAQIAANGCLDLQTGNAAVAAAGSKTQFLAEFGADYKQDVAETYGYLKAIKEDEVTNNTLVDAYLDKTDPATGTQWKAFKSILSNLVAALESAANDSWNALNVLKTGLNAASYEKLEKLVAAVEATTAVTVKNPLVVATSDVQANLSMKNVEITVVLKTVGEEADSAELVEQTSAPVVLTLEEGISAEQVTAAINESGIIENALSAWADIYVAEHFEATCSALPNALNEDVKYTVTYAPKSYAVTSSYADEISVPYGYQLTLPVHEDAEKAYDYKVNGESYAQGEIYTVVGETEITRTAGKAYAVTDLYSVIADNFGNDIAKNILSSGALLGNETINVRKPDPADSTSLLTLVNNVLTAAEYKASYEGLSWVPYTYGELGTENKFSGNSANWTPNSAKVQYKLELSNVDVATVDEVLKLVAVLKADAKGQTDALNSLVNYYKDMGDLDKTKLGAMNGVIDVTDLTPDDGTETDEANVELRAYFKALVSQIINNNIDTNNQLKIYNMLTEYQKSNGGLRYYYNNSAAVIAEVAALSENLNGLVGDAEKEAALEVLMGAAGYPQYVEKVAKLGDVMAEVKANLTAPNAAIDLTSENLGKLITALTTEGDVVTDAAATPYLLSDVLTALDESQVMVQVIVEINGKSATFTTAAVDQDTEFSSDMRGDLEKQIGEFVEAVENYQYYDVEIVGGSLDALVGTPLTSNVNIYYTYSPKEYTVKIDGVEDQVVTILDLEINLPQHEDYPKFEYRYTVNGEATDAGVFTFTAAQLDSLFVNGVCTAFARTEVNAAEEKLENTLGSSEYFELVRDENTNEITGMKSTVAVTKDGMTNFAMALVDSGYSYIGLNGEAFLYLENDTLQISLQTLINALLNDNTFGSQTIIDLGDNNGGKLVSASMQLGNSAEELMYENMPYELILENAPSQMVTAAVALDTVKNYIGFHAQDGVMVVDLNLPEDVYAVYLAGLLTTGNVDKTDINAINNEIAFQFFYDYIELVAGTDADVTSMFNTLKMLGASDATIDNILNRLPEKADELVELEKYYSYCKKALSSSQLNINEEENGIFEMNFSAKGTQALTLFNMIGLDLSSFETYIGMVKELKDGGEIYGAVEANLKNTAVTYEAAVLDIRASGDSKVEKVLNKLDLTADLPARVAELAGAAVIVLLDDVDGDLTFNAATILDLNGQTVNGNIISNGDQMLIMDSCLGANKAGSVNGTVSGNVTIVAGNYSSDVTAYLADGFVQNGAAVQNMLYTVENVDGALSFNLNTSLIDERNAIGSYAEFALAVGGNIATDFILNYFSSAALAADGNIVYNVVLDDLIGLYASAGSKGELVNKVLNFIDADDLSAFVNTVLDDLFDFAAIEAAINNGENVAEYTLTTMPWSVGVEYKAEGDYLTFGIVPNAAKAKSLSIALKVDGDHKSYIANLAGGLSEIVSANSDINVGLEQPYYANKTLYVAGSGKAVVDLDLTKDNNLTNSLHFSAKDYTTVLAVVLANGNPDKADALIAAIDDRNELKAIINTITVKEYLAAMVALNSEDTFMGLVEELGISDGGVINDFVDKTYFEDEANLEKIYHLVICGAGWIVEKLQNSETVDKVVDKLEDGSVDVNGAIDKVQTSVDVPDAVDTVVDKAQGNAKVQKVIEYVEAALERLNLTELGNKTLGGLDQDGDGIYELSVSNKNPEGDATVRGYTFDFDVAIEEIAFRINIFGVQLGDVDCDGDVDNVDAMLVLQHYVGLIGSDALDANAADVNGDGEINNVDAMLILQHYVGLINEFPAEK